MEWIDVKEKLPDQGVEVILTDNNQSPPVFCGDLRGNHFYVIDLMASLRRVYPTHWMPLPDPPKNN